MAAAAAEEEGLESAFFFTKSGFVHEYGGIVAAAVADGVAPLGLSMHISGACSTIHSRLRQFLIKFQVPETKAT